MELFVICSVTEGGRYVIAADTNEERADRKAKETARDLAREYDATVRAQTIANPLNGGPNVGKVYHVRKAGEWIANVELYSVWE